MHTYDTRVTPHAPLQEGHSLPREPLRELLVGRRSVRHLEPGHEDAVCGAEVVQEGEEATGHGDREQHGSRHRRHGNTQQPQAPQKC